MVVITTRTGLGPHRVLHRDGSIRTVVAASGYPLISHSVGADPPEPYRHTAMIRCTDLPRPTRAEASCWSCRAWISSRWLEGRMAGMAPQGRFACQDFLVAGTIVGVKLRILCGAPPR